MADLEPKIINPDFVKSGGLIPAIAQDAQTGEILMLAYMNAEALEATMATGQAHYFSRSRQELWHKGGTSGHVQLVKGIRLDCDGDSILLLVEQVGGAACHTGHRSCFHFHHAAEGFVEVGEKIFDPRVVYGQ